MNLTLLGSNYILVKLINQFKTGNIKTKDFDQIRFDINNLNYFEYLFLLNEILLDIEINESIFKLLFNFSYSKDHIFHRESEPLIEFIGFIKMYDFDELYPDYYNKNIIDRLLSLFYFKNNILNNITRLGYQVIDKLYFLKEVKDLRILFKDIEGEDDFLEDIYKVESRSIFDIIIEQVSFQPYDLSLIYFEIDKKIWKECFNASKLYNSDNIDFKVISFLIDGPDLWKKKIAEDLLLDKEKFNYKKLQYIECLNEFKRRTSQDYITQEINHHDYLIEQPDGSKRHITANPYKIKKLKKWIEVTFKSFNKIKDLNMISIVEELPIKNKIILSLEINQSIIRQLLVTFFSEIKIELDSKKLNSINSFVSNFFDFNEGHHSKYITKMPYEPLSFIPRENFKDFARIFLIFQHDKIKLILSNKETILDVLVALFFNKNENRGYSKDTLKRLDLTFSKGFKVLKSQMSSQMTPSQKTYFLLHFFQ